MRYLALLVLCVMACRGAEPETDNQRLQRVKAEVERRKLLREQEVTALENAFKVVREHESGTNKATDEQLAAAREMIRKADAKRQPLGPNEPASLSMPDADMTTVVTAWRALFGGTVTVADRAKAKVVSVKIPASPRDELRKKFLAALRESGVFVFERPDGVVLDIEPESKPST
jgi:hypothetical protein